MELFKGFHKFCMEFHLSFVFLPKFYFYFKTHFNPSRGASFWIAILPVRRYVIDPQLAPFPYLAIVETVWKEKCITSCPKSPISCAISNTYAGQVLNTTCLKKIRIKISLSSSLSPKQRIWKMEKLEKNRKTEKKITQIIRK